MDFFDYKLFLRNL